MGRVNKYFPKLNAMGNAAYRAARLYYSNGSLRALRQLLAHLGRKVARRSVPTFMTLAPTFRCQLRCVHCYAEGRAREDHNELTTSEIKSVCDQAKELGLLQVTFSGGEPLLREDLPELVRHAHDIGLLTRISTNGWLLEPEVVARLKEAGLTQCGVSIDSADPEVHDGLRGVPGAYQKAVEGIRNLRDAGILCQINTYAAKRNIAGGVKKIITLARELGALSVYIFFPMAVGRWEGATDEMLSAEDRARARELQDLTFVHVEVPTPRSTCPLFMRSLLYVSAIGDVTPCPFVPYVLGNIRERPLRDVWLRHCAQLNFDYKDDCVLNDGPWREKLARHAESVARGPRQSCRH